MALIFSCLGQIQWQLTASSEIHEPQNISRLESLCSQSKSVTL